jgi:hypothetical protein
MEYLIRDDGVHSLAMDVLYLGNSVMTRHGGDALAYEHWEVKRKSRVRWW